MLFIMFGGFRSVSSIFVRHSPGFLVITLTVPFFCISSWRVGGLNESFGVWDILGIKFSTCLSMIAPASVVRFGRVTTKKVDIFHP